MVTVWFVVYKLYFWQVAGGGRTAIVDPIECTPHAIDCRHSCAVYFWRAVSVASFGQLPDYY